MGGGGGGIVEGPQSSRRDNGGLTWTSPAPGRCEKASDSGSALSVEPTDWPVDRHRVSGGRGSGVKWLRTDGR